MATDTDKDPSSSDIASLFTVLRGYEPERQRRLVVATLILCGMYREAQTLVDMAVREAERSEESEKT